MKHRKQLTVKEAIEIGIEVGLQKALEQLKKERERKRKSRYDRRLRNTHILLKNYNSFATHCDSAIYTKQQLLENNAIDILDEMEELDQETYVKSIMRTKERTAIIMNHIKRVLDFYEFQAQKSEQVEKQRRLLVIKAIYFDEKKYEEVAEEMSVSVKTVNRDKRTAIAEISTLVFGIDGLKFEA